MNCPRSIKVAIYSCLILPLAIGATEDNAKSIFSILLGFAKTYAQISTSINAIRAIQTAAILPMTAWMSSGYLIQLILGKSHVLHLLLLISMGG